jgi:crossover junction endodeoxyribonuclease RuvC
MDVYLSEIFAVDPGLNGAWACLDFKGSFIRAGEIPRFSKHINAAEFVNIIRLYRPKQIIIEQVSAMPKQGVTSVFTFGVAYGTVIGIASGAGIPVHFVIPRRWKSHFKLIGREKEASRELAIQLYPAAASSLTLKKHHGRADALLLARYFLDRQRQGLQT